MGEGGGGCLDNQIVQKIDGSSIHVYYTELCSTTLIKCRRVNKVYYSNWAVYLAFR